MSSHGSGGRQPSDQSYRPHPRHSDEHGSMYDDHPPRAPSHSHSPPTRSGIPRYGSPGGTRSPPHEDTSRIPPRGPAVDRMYAGDSGGPSSRDYSRDLDSRPEHQNRGRKDDYPRRLSHSPQPPRRGRTSYRDRDREDYRSPSYDSPNRSRSRSRSRNRSHGQRRGRGPNYGQESREIMMEGLPVDLVEDDVSNQLSQDYRIEGLEEVRVIRDRQTKISRRLGFLRFRSIDDSRAFLEPNFPSIYLYGNDANGEDGATKVRIAYSREREDRGRAKEEGEWVCKICTLVNYPGRQRCFRCQAIKSDFTPSVPTADAALRVANTGDNDAAPEGTPSQFILIRGLESSVTEELLAKGIAKLYKPLNSSNAQETPANPKKGAKVASTTGDSNLGARDGSIRRVLLVRDRRSNESWKYGFAEFATVEDAQAALTRYNSFEKFTISSKPVLASYIHAGVFVPVINPTPSNERFTFSPLGNPSMKLAYWDEDAYVTELMISTEDPDKNRGKLRRSEPAKTNKESDKAKKESDKAKKRKAETSRSGGEIKKLAVPSHLQFWSNRHAELHGIGKEKDGQVGEGSPEATNKGTSEGSGSHSPAPTVSFGDLERKCCYLCMRQFNTEAEVNRHERLSQLHRDNFQNEELKAKALAKMENKRNQQQSSGYRDRAKERRQAFGVSRHPSKAAKTKDKKPEPDNNDAAEPVPVMSKGASLLGKMGWSAGSGLGAQGTGMTAPIATDVYAQGVGLGAQGGKLGDAVEEAGRNTRGRYDEFLEKTKEGARERYERLG